MGIDIGNCNTSRLSWERGHPARIFKGLPACRQTGEQDAGATRSFVNNFRNHANFQHIWAVLIFALLMLPFCAYAVAENSDDASVAQQIDAAAGSTENAAATTDGAKTVEDKLMTMKTPANVLELIENLQEVHQSRIAFEEAFYTEENIMKITAGKDVDIYETHYQENKKIDSQPIDLRSITDDLGVDEKTACIQVSILFTVKTDGKKHVTIHVILCRVYPSLHYPAIEKLFGHLWQRRKFEPLGTYEVYQPPTDIHGNKKMEYSRQDGNVAERGYFTFTPDGLLNNLSLYAEEQ